jgi:hypothetical protein
LIKKMDAWKITYRKKIDPTWVAPKEDAVDAADQAKKD